MQGKQVLLDLLEDNNGRVHQLLEECNDVLLHWQSDPEANSIASTLWHVSHVFDVFMNQHIQDLPYQQEAWFQSGWEQKTGYNPHGSGTNGWGMLTDYRVQEMQKIPALEKEVLRRYFDEVISVIRSFLEQTGEQELAKAAPGYAGRQTKFFWIRHALFDLTRHVGEMMAFKPSWIGEYETRSDRLCLLSLNLQSFQLA
jgi:uncharacterized damage-inducible protein DinB